jgi:hypothetical protein
MWDGDVRACTPEEMRILVAMGLVGFFARLQGLSQWAVEDLVDTTEIRARQWLRSRAYDRR